MELPRPAVVVALLTPYDDGGAPDHGALRAHVDLLVEAGSMRSCPAEPPARARCSATTRSRASCARRSRRRTAACPVLAHVGRPGTATTLALAHRAIADGAAAVAAVVPYYYTASDDQIRAHFGALIEGVDAPVYGYTIPSHTHRELEPGLLERLIGDGLAGLKDSTKSPERHREYAAAVRAAGAPFALFTGSAGSRPRGARRGVGGCRPRAREPPPGAVRRARARGARGPRRRRRAAAGGDARARRGAQGGGADPGAEARRGGAPRRPRGRVPATVRAPLAPVAAVPAA